MRVSALALFCASVGLALTSTAASADSEEARRLAAQNRPEEARALLENYLAQAPDDLEARLLYGVVLIDLGLLDHAQAELQHLVVRCPQLPEPHNNLGVLYAVRGDFVEAERSLVSASAALPVAQRNLRNLSARLTLSRRARVGAADRIPDISLSTTSVLINSELCPPQPAKLETAEPATASADEDRVGDVPRSGVAEEEVADDAAASARTQIEALIGDWARAWEKQEIQAYVGFYSAAFLPERGQNRQAWEATRRQEVAAAKSISIELGPPLIDVERGSATAQVRFCLRYTAGTESELGIKTLDLVLEPRLWRIVRERFEKSDCSP